MKTGIITFFMSMIPVIELRGALPYGVIGGLSVQVAFIMAAGEKHKICIPLPMKIQRTNGK